jgi:inorganic triphosphatase YgiF
MELEMKYAIPDKETADAIWADEQLDRLTDSAEAEAVVMKAVYFDTEDGALRANNITLRVRAEGESAFATLKWGGHAEGGLHERQEINVPVSGEEDFINPPIGIFRESDEGRALSELIGDKPLINLLETRFLRRRKRLAYSDSIMEMAVDTGSIVTDNGVLPILELELELFAGEEKSIAELGGKIAEKYGLSPEDRSKFARGLALLGKDDAKEQ